MSEMQDFLRSIRSEINILNNVHDNIRILLGQAQDMLLKSDYSAQWLGDCTVQELVAQRNSLLITCGTIRTMLGPAVTEDMAVELHEQFTPLLSSTLKSDGCNTYLLSDSKENQEVLSKSDDHHNNTLSFEPGQDPKPLSFEPGQRWSSEFCNKSKDRSSTFFEEEEERRKLFTSVSSTAAPSAEQNLQTAAGTATADASALAANVRTVLNKVNTNAAPTKLQSPKGNKKRDIGSQSLEFEPKSKQIRMKWTRSYDRLPEKEPTKAQLRGKARKYLPAYVCGACERYYGASGVPVQACSRHRTIEPQHEPNAPPQALSPPYYWEIGFPSTQELKRREKEIWVKGKTRYELKGYKD